MTASDKQTGLTHTGQRPKRSEEPSIWSEQTHFRRAEIGPFKANCYFIARAGQALVIDPGLGAESWVMEQLAESGAELEAILLTHGHIDHTRDAPALQRRYRVPVFVHELDAPMLANPGAGVQPGTALLYKAETMRPLSAANGLEFVSPGHDLQLAGWNVNVIHAPGHTPGSVFYRFGNDCFCGDVIFQGTIGRTDLPLGDAAQMERSLKEVVLRLPLRTALHPGHGDRTNLADERDHKNPYLARLRHGHSIRELLG